MQSLRSKHKFLTLGSNLGFDEFKELTANQSARIKPTIFQANCNPYLPLKKLQKSRVYAIRYYTSKLRSELVYVAFVPNVSSRSELFGERYIFLKYTR